MPLPSDWQHRATKLQWSTNEHGDEACQFALDIPTTDAVTLAATGAGEAVVVYDRLGAPVWRGRIEDPSIALGGEGSFEAAALGGWAALGDLEDSYTAVWSTTSYAGWRPATTEDQIVRTAQKGEFDESGRLFVAPRKGEQFSSAGSVLAQMYQTPVNSRSVVGIQFDWRFRAPTNWQFLVVTFDRAYATQTVQTTTNATGAVLSGAVHGIFSPGAERIEFALYYNAAAANYTGETGEGAYLEITNLRLTTSTANRVNTTLTGAVVAGNNVTASVGSTARMYVGQRLIINSSVATGVSESVIVESITSSTQFVADFALAHASGQAVQAHVVYGNEVASDVADFVNSVNPAQLEAGGMITAMTTDLTDALWEDATPSQVLNDLLPKDGTPWAVGVDRGILYFRARGIGARSWVIDVADVTLTLSLAELVNSAYAIYENVAGEVVRSAVDSDLASVGQYGLTRRRSISVKTTSATQAAAQVAALLEDKARLSARVTIPGITALYDLYGNRWPLWEVNAGRGDTITIRNVAPEIASSLDAQLTFRISRTNYDALDDTLTVELEAPTPTL